MLPPGFSLLLVVLHITEGCNLKNHEEMSHLAAVAGDAVLLPCECSSLQISPRNLIWRKYGQNDWRSVPTNQARFQLSNGQALGNLSLLISELEVKDEGLYRCDTGNSYTDLQLRVTGAAITKVSRDAFYSLIPAVLLVLGLGGVVLWRYKAKNRKQTANSEGPTRQENEQEPRRSEQEPRRNEQEPQRNEQEPQRNEQEPRRSEQEPRRSEQEPRRSEQESQDDVMTYTTVIHTKTQQHKTLSADDGTEYASIRFN